VNRIRFVQ